MEHVVCITATCGRHTLLERSVGMFLNQDYEGPHTMLILNNSEISQQLDSSIQLPENKRIILVNRYQSSTTGKPYQTLGEIYNDGLTFVPSDADIITHWDDDDLFLPNHISEGVAGFNRAYGKKAYKPEKSYYRSHSGIVQVSNTMEPSIFVAVDHMKSYGYYNTTSDQHLSWVNGLVYNDLIFVDPLGKSTLIYNWADDVHTFKTSGNANNPHNFNNYRTFSQDHGDQVITPWEPNKFEPLYGNI